MGVGTEEVYYYYSTTCLSAPFFGITIGGVFFSYIGGYNS